LFTGARKFVAICQGRSSGGKGREPAAILHASAKTTLDTYGHLLPGRDESTRAAVDAVLQDRADSPRTTAGLR
jgi:hypothetical protein